MDAPKGAVFYCLKLGGLPFCHKSVMIIVERYCTQRRAKMTKWEIKRDNETLSWGTSEASFPNAKERKMFRADGYKIYVDGKLYKD